MRRYRKSSGSGRSAPHLDLGRWGEDVAARWYFDSGYEVLDRNWRCSFGEIDLIARRGSVLVIGEVKTRRTSAFGSPSLAVGFAKQQRLRRLAVEWLRSTGTRAPTIRFDVVAISGTSVDVIEGAF